jgi:hypothetical protein
MFARFSSILVLTIVSTLVSTLVSFEASAYIPSSRFILSRLAKNNGKGAYQVEQDVQFRTDSEPVILRERWTVENGDSLRVSVTGKSATETYRYEALYKDGKRHVVDATGAVKTSSLPAEFFEPYLYLRGTKSILEMLVRQKIVPANFLAYKKQVKSFNGVVYPLESFVRLSRAGGAITYAFGNPTPANATRRNPGFWVEQDSFLLRRLRYPSRAEVEADNHLFATSGFRIPRDRTVTWETSAATIKIASVKSAQGAAVSKLLTTTSLQGAKQKLPDAPAVQEFYSRFR